MIRFVEINSENWRLPLKVSKEQEKEVADKTVILARAYAFRKKNSKAFYIYEDDLAVGKGLVYDCEEMGCYILSQFFIDERYQKQGFGTKAFRKLIEEMREENKYKQILLTYIERNLIAKKFYEKVGFRYACKQEDEVEMILDFEK